MNEEILIKSEKYNLKKAAVILSLIFIIAPIVLFATLVAVDYARFEQDYMDYYEAGIFDYIWDYASADDYARAKLEYCHNRPDPPNDIYSAVHKWHCLWLVISGIIIVSAVYLWLRHYELTVTNKRIYGTVIFGKRVDIPKDSISAVSMNGFLKGVSVASSSGKIGFLLIKNASDIYDVINNMLMERQNKSDKLEAEVSFVSQSNADELKKYKELLDAGVITQEEFDAKKKQLLGV